jgi:hypothetical protein
MGREDGSVQGVVERFRRTYNARLVTHREVRSSLPLKFQNCNITLDAFQAMATCIVSPQGSVDGEPPPVWTFTLEHDEGAWAIRSIVTEDHH